MDSVQLLRYSLLVLVALAGIAGCSRPVRTAIPAAPGTAIKPAIPPAVPRSEVGSAGAYHVDRQRPTTWDRSGHAVTLPEAAGAGPETVAAPEIVGTDTQGRRLRVSILRYPDAKYPLVRRVEVLSGDGPDGAVVAVQEMVADHLIVTGADAAAVQALPPGTSVRKRIPGTRDLLIGIPADTVRDLPEAAAALLATGGVRAADPDYLVRATWTPDDTRFPEQWALDNLGQTGGSSDADINAPEAWEIAKDASGVLIGVIDSGIDLEHPDLDANLWRNPGEIPGNGIDDDGNGFVDDDRGWNFHGDNRNPDDDHFHGTHVAGTIGAAGGNGIGVTGVCWRAAIVPIKFLGADGGGYLSDAVAAVAYAHAIGCDITNNSWGGGGYVQSLRDAIAAAGADGMLFVAAAGNESNDNDRYPSYPADYDLASVLSVAATDHHDRIASFSNHGDPGVDIAAPGVGILSTFPTETTREMTSRGLPAAYASISGTSMAAPHISGALALLKAVRPDLGVGAVRERLLARADRIGSLQGVVNGAGRLDLHALLDPGWVEPPARLEVTSTSAHDQIGNGNGSFEPGERLSVTALVSNLGGRRVESGTLAIRVAEGGSVISGATVALPALAPLGSAPAQTFTVEIGQGLRTGDRVVLDWTVSWDGGSRSATQVLAAAQPMTATVTRIHFTVADIVADPARDLFYVIDASQAIVHALSASTGRVVQRGRLQTSYGFGRFGNDNRAHLGVGGGMLYLCNTAARRIHRLVLPDLVWAGDLELDFYPNQLVQAADGMLYVGDADVHWSPIRRIDPVTGEVLGVLPRAQVPPSDQPALFYASPFIRLSEDRTRIFAANHGLSVVGGPDYIRAYDVQAGSPPAFVMDIPFWQRFLRDFRPSRDQGRIYIMCSGIYAMQVAAYDGSRWGEFWDYPQPYASSVAVPPGSAFVYAGTPYHDVNRFRASDGLRLGATDLTDVYNCSAQDAMLAATRDDRLLTALEGLDTPWRLALIGADLPIVT
ncbi:MAG: hypothetical protein RLZZ127_2607, partial [Planctomycetota bacterium]